MVFSKIMSKVKGSKTKPVKYKPLLKSNKSLDATKKICEAVSKAAIYLLVFLVPLFLLPWTANVLDFNKQALLIVLVFISLFAWMAKILIMGRITFKLTKIHIAVGVLFLISLASTIFSLWRYGSFWGWPLNVSESLLSLLCLALFYFLIVNIFEKKDIPRLITLLILSSFFVMFYGVLQLFGKFVLPWDFTKNVSFNTVGSINKLGLFSAVLLPLIITSLVAAKNKLWKIVFAAVLAMSVFLLVIINFSIIWWVVIVVAALIMVAGMQRGDVFDNRWLVLPMFLLAISLFFTFFNFRVPGVPLRPTEVYLSQGASLDIAVKTLKQRPILGSGPGTFIYDFSKYKDKSFNMSSFWNVRFDGAGSRIVNTLATTGGLGIISFFALIALTIFYGVKFIFKKSVADGNAEKEEETEKMLWLTKAGIFIAFLSLVVGYFLYNSNLTIDFTFFLLIGSFIVLLPLNKKEFLIKPSSLFTLGITFAFTIIFIFGLGFFILEGQRYSAEYSYLKALKANQIGDADEALSKIEGAVRLSPKMDVYLRELSQIYLARIALEAQRTDLSREGINQRIQILINSAVNSSKTATDVNPNNVANWSVRGFIYRDLIGVVGGVENWAIESYNKASEFEPANPYYPAQKGIILLRKLNFTPEESSNERAGLIAEAKIQFERAIELKSDYAPARFQLAMVYQSQGKIQEAIEELKAARSSAPFDIGLAFQLGLIYFQNQDYNNAQLEFERAIGINPDYANALYFLGLTYDKQGTAPKAIIKFERLVELNSNNTELQTILTNLKAGRNALDGILEDVPPNVPIDEEEPSEE